MCSVAAPWRSCATRTRSASTCSARCRASCRRRSRRATPTTRRGRSTRCSAPTRCCSTAISPMRSRSTSMRCRTARTCSSPASWSTSRRPASIPAISACSLPPRSLSPEMLADLEAETRRLALALNVVGLMNVQYAIKDGDIYVLEVNPRASRTVPFVAKVIGQPIAKIAARTDGRRVTFLLRPQADEAGPCRCEGSGVPLRPVPGRRHGARPRDALDRRGHRARPLVRYCLRQEPARRGAPRCR